MGVCVRAPVVVYFLLIYILSAGISKLLDMRAHDVHMTEDRSASSKVAKSSHSRYADELLELNFLYVAFLGVDRYYCEVAALQLPEVSRA